MQTGAPSPIIDALAGMLDAVMGRQLDPGSDDQPHEARLTAGAGETPIAPPLDAGIAPPIHTAPPEPVTDGLDARDRLGAPTSDLTGPPARVQTAGITATIAGGGQATLICPGSAVPRRILLAVVQDPTAAGIVLSIAPDPRQDATGFRPTVAHGVLTLETPAPIYAYVTTGAVLPAIVSVWVEPRGKC